MKKITLKSLLPVFIIAGASAVFVLLKATEPQATPSALKERRWPVNAKQITLESLSPVINLYGQVETPALVNAAAPRNSRVSLIHIAEGERVNKGQLLLELDERDFIPRVRQAEARVAELQALIASEETRYKNDQTALTYEKSLLDLENSAVERAKQLKQKNLGSTATLELAQEELNRQRLSFSNRQLAIKDHQARLQQIQARLSYAEAELELARLDLERSRIVADFDGIIEKLQVAPGDQVKENQILLNLFSIENLEIRAKIPTVFQTEIQTALFQEQHLGAQAQFGDLSFPLSLSRLSGQADARGIDALFAIDSELSWIRPGSSVSLYLQRPLQSNVAVLPYSALYDNNVIYRINQGRLESLSVTIAGNYSQANQDMLLVRSSELKTGDSILITHLPNAIQGMPVEIQDKRL